MKTTKFYKKNFTPQLWAFLQSKNLTTEFVRNATNPKALGALAANPNLVINQFDTAFSFEKVNHTSLWMRKLEEWKAIEQTISRSVMEDEKAPHTLKLKTCGLYVALFFFAVSIIGVNTATDQYVNLACTAVAFTCMCSIFCLLLSGPYPKEETNQHSFTTNAKQLWTKQ